MESRADNSVGKAVSIVVLTEILFWIVAGLLAAAGMWRMAAIICGLAVAVWFFMRSAGKSKLVCVACGQAPSQRKAR